MRQKNLLMLRQKQSKKKVQNKEWDFNFYIVIDYLSFNKTP